MKLVKADSSKQDYLNKSASAQARGKGVSVTDSNGTDKKVEEIRESKVSKTKSFRNTHSSNQSATVNASGKGAVIKCPVAFRRDRQAGETNCKEDGMKTRLF